jgi:hypothetical protein
MDGRYSTLTEAVLELAGEGLHVPHAARTLVLATSSLETPVVCPKTTTKQATNLDPE